MLSVLTVLSILSAYAQATAPAADHWAVLVAGSSGYMNYRHQADVCHAYHVVLGKGIPADHIIVMAYDDIANSSMNEFPGKIFNKPTKSGTPGKDVYAGCKIDYSGKDVTPDNFVRVLTGGDSIEPAEASLPPTSMVVEEPTAQATCHSFGPGGKRAQCATRESCCCTKKSFFRCDAWSCCDSSKREQCMGAKGCVAPRPSSGRVLKSTANSKVFINFVDHGAVNLIGFPNGMTMHATELVSTLTKMHTKKMYKELVFYLEACESGSMFTQLPQDISVYATTAANAHESSWGTYCGADAMVDGKNLQTCLGDLYSVNWMEDSDLGTGGETIEAQYNKVKTETNKSHVMEFGAKAIASEPLVQFQGDASASASASAASAARTAAPSADGQLDARNIELVQTLRRYLAKDEDTDAEELMRLVADRLAAKRTFTEISLAVASKDVASEPTPATETHPKCHFAAHKAYVAACGGWTAGALKHSATLVKLCELTGGDADKIGVAIRSACARQQSSMQSS